MVFDHLVSTPEVRRHDRRQLEPWFRVDERGVEHRAAETEAHQQDLGGFQLLLPFDAHLRDDQMAAVAQDLFFAQRRLGRSFHGRAAGDGRDQRNGVAVLGLAGIFAQIADVFVIQVHVHEAADLALVGEDLLAQVGELGGQRAQYFAYGGAGNGDGILFPGKLPQGRGD